MMARVSYTTGYMVYSGHQGACQTFPKWTSSKTTSSGWLMPQNLVRKAKPVMRPRASLYSISEPALAGATALGTLSISTSEEMPFLAFLVETGTFLWRRVASGIAVVEAMAAGRSGYGLSSGLFDID